MLENLSHENTETDVFKDFIRSYVWVLEHLERLVNLEELDLDECGFNRDPFGKNIVKVLNTSQALTGFGAAIGRLKDFGKLESLEKFYLLPVRIESGSDELNDWFIELLLGLDKVNKESKKIGNGQRMLFQYFFRELFNPESDSYLNLYLSAKNSYQKYRSQV